MGFADVAAKPLCETIPDILGGTKDGCDWSSQLMGDRGDKVALLFGQVHLVSHFVLLDRLDGSTCKLQGKPEGADFLGRALRQIQPDNRNLTRATSLPVAL